MAKLSFTKINKPAKPIDVITVDFQGEKLEIKQYLPTKDKVEMLEEYCAYFLGDKVYNPLKEEVYKRILLIKYYTNVSFTEKQMENVELLNDKITLSGLYDVVLENLKEKDDCIEIKYYMSRMSDALVRYKTSFVGAIEMLSQQKELANMLDMEKILAEIKDPDMKAFVENFKNLDAN